jgi:chemotaxis protein MotB
MARKKAHEEHANHEAWAIPYGDLITLLLAFFVVMYAVSSINEGKFRVLADAMAEAFGGPPKSIRPLQVGRPQRGNSSGQSAPAFTNRLEQSVGGTVRDLRNPQVIAGRLNTPVPQHQVNAAGNTGYERERVKLQKIAEAVQQALGALIEKDLVVVRKTELWVEIEIKTDILFASGSADLDEAAVPVLRELAAILAPHPNRLRVEGHTDDVPISTWQFPSNWELSAARGASVLRLLVAHGLDPQRMAVIGMGEHDPRADNATAQGRNANRRVTIVLLADAAAPAPPPAAGG